MPVKFRMASEAAAPSATRQVQAVHDVLAVQDQMLGWAGHEGMVRAREEEERKMRAEEERKLRAQEQIQ